ncbi:MAG: hypothetical protein ACRD82_07080 [Blastocatellia bacterium]
MCNDEALIASSSIVAPRLGCDGVFFPAMNRRSMVNRRSATGMRWRLVPGDESPVYGQSSLRDWDDCRVVPGDESPVYGQSSLRDWDAAGEFIPQWQTIFTNKPSR